MRSTNTHVYFWGSFLSNWIPSDLSIHYDDEIFTNSEQLFMYLKAKYFKDDEVAQEIVDLGQDPRTAKDLGRKVKNYNEKKWNDVREEMMFRAVLAKFTSNKTLHDKLLKTENKILVEGTPFDKIWGVGIRWDDDLILDERNWQGQNLLGKVLMKVRKELKY